MDSLTHAASGAALLLALPNRPATKWAVPLTIAVSCLPDIDVVFNRINRVPIDFMLFHRGITHSLPAMPILALLCAFLMYPFWRRGAPGAWTFRQTALFAFALLLMHVWLDCVTNYGTLAFLPFSDYRVRLNGLFIIDLLLLVPLILACCTARRRSRIAALAIIWLLLYSGGAVAWNIHLQNKWNASLRADGVEADQLSVLPDVFAPLYWKVQYEHNGQCFQAPLAWDGSRAGAWEQQKSAGPDLIARLMAEDRSARVWMKFSLLPLREEQAWEGGKEYSFYDWRFGSLVPFVQNWRANTASVRLMARVDGAGNLVAVRYSRYPAMDESGWQPPVKPKGRSGINWLIGLDD
ncbi:MAG: metal-dependent hydrolase [Synergistaceae bacterium]|nr:metal-dependent hydrolase [Synergistaceae bacterium]